MKRLILLFPLIVVISGCAYPAASFSNGYAGQPPAPPRPYGPQLNFAAMPVGRWDNVMMTAVGTALFVLMRNGDTATGAIISVTDYNLRLHVAAGEVDLRASEVMRVDRITTNRDVVKDGARGAAYGAAFIGVVGLIVGHVPPVRTFAAGGILGASQGVQDSLASRHATTIYIARGIVPPGPGPQPGTPQTPSPGVSGRGPCGFGGTVCDSQVRYGKVKPAAVR